MSLTKHQLCNIFDNRQSEHEFSQQLENTKEKFREIEGILFIFIFLILPAVTSSFRLVYLSWISLVLNIGHLLPSSRKQKRKIPWNPQCGPENLKKSRPKKLVTSNKSISRNFYWPKSIFCHFKNGQKSIFELGKSLKLLKIQFHEFFFDQIPFFAISKMAKNQFLT